VAIFFNSYDNLNNLSCECEYLQINNLDFPLNNLPHTIKEIRLNLPHKVNIKKPFDCKIYIDDMLHSL
jgi:hypothetical protein